MDRLIVRSGVTGHRDDGSIDEDAEAQMRQAFRNLDAVLRAEGGSLSTIVRLTSFFADAADHPVFRQVRRGLLPEPYPASTGVVVGRLLPGMRIELEALAMRGDGRTVGEPDPRSAAEPSVMEGDPNH